MDQNNQQSINVKKPFYKKVGFWVILITIFVAIGVGASSSDKESPNNNTSTISVDGDNKQETEGEHDGIWHDGKFTVLNADKSPDSNEFAMYIDGTIRNDSGKDMSYVQVQFITYDAEGNTIGSCMDNNSGLNADGTWKYHAMCLNPGSVSRYEVKDVTGTRKF